MIAKMISYRERGQYRNMRKSLSSTGRLDGYYNRSTNYWHIERNDIYNYASIISDNKDII